MFTIKKSKNIFILAVLFSLFYGCKKSSLQNNNSGLLGDDYIINRGEEFLAKVSYVAQNAQMAITFDKKPSSKIAKEKETLRFISFGLQKDSFQKVSMTESGSVVLDVGNLPRVNLQVHEWACMSENAPLLNGFSGRCVNFRDQCTSEEGTISGDTGNACTCKNKTVVNYKDFFEKNLFFNKSICENSGSFTDDFSRVKFKRACDIAGGTIDTAGNLRCSCGENSAVYIDAKSLQLELFQTVCNLSPEKVKKISDEWKNMDNLGGDIGLKSNLTICLERGKVEGNSFCRCEGGLVLPLNIPLQDFQKQCVGSGKISSNAASDNALFFESRKEFLTTVEKIKCDDYNFFSYVCGSYDFNYYWDFDSVKGTCNVNATQIKFEEFKKFCLANAKPENNNTKPQSSTSSDSNDIRNWFPATYKWFDVLLVQEYRNSDMCETDDAFKYACESSRGGLQEDYLTCFGENNQQLPRNEFIDYCKALSK